MRYLAALTIKKRTFLDADGEEEAREAAWLFAQQLPDDEETLEIEVRIVEV